VKDDVIALTVVNGAERSFVQDEDGNTISITDHTTSETTFVWGAVDQLLPSEYEDGIATEFDCDAMGRC